MQPNDGIDGVEAARARVAQQIAAAEARKNAVHRLADEVKSLSATVRSPRGEVTVTASPGGRVSSVAIASDGIALGADALSKLVTETVAAAQHRAASEGVARSAEILGDTSPVVAQLRAEVDASFPPPSGTIEYR